MQFSAKVILQLNKLPTIFHCVESGKYQESVITTFQFFWKKSKIILLQVYFENKFCTP